jgi:hypothetical protein
VAIAFSGWWMLLSRWSNKLAKTGTLGKSGRVGDSRASCYAIKEVAGPYIPLLVIGVFLPF